VAGYTDCVFRSLCAESGADFSFTELVSAEALVRSPGRYGLVSGSGEDSARPAGGALLIKRGRAEKRYAVQLFGSESETLGRACALLAPLNLDAVDLNAGCPVPKVVKNGAGSALMRDPIRLGRAVETMVKASEKALGGIPVSVKIRSGWDAAHKNYAECGRAAQESGAALVSLHPRTRSQFYSGASEWPLIADLACRLSIPVAGSGDIFTPEDAAAMLAETGCAAVMFARGALGNPFIFEETISLLTAGSRVPADPARRLVAGLKHLEGLVVDAGEKTACLEMRKQFCAYTKGMPGGAPLRQRLIHAETIDQYRDIIDQHRSILAVSGCTGNCTAGD
jgi:nifR3 family TIM-barrel protein